MSEFDLRDQLVNLRLDVKILMQAHADMRRELAVQTDTIQKLLAWVHHLESQR